MWKKIKAFLSKLKPSPRKVVMFPSEPVKAPVPAPEAPVLKVPPTPGKKQINLDVFIREVEKHYRKLKDSQKSGFVYIIQKWEKSGYTDLRWLAYMLATTWHETAYTMQPVTEYGSRAYLRSKKYWPYIGRGYVQLTHKRNYEKYGIADDMEKALDPEFAAEILIEGMIAGTFSGVGLPKYFNKTGDDPVNARRIINGTSSAHKLAAHHRNFLKCLHASKVG